MIEVAASMWPKVDGAHDGLHWRGLVHREVGEFNGRADFTNTRVVARDVREYQNIASGAWPRIEIAPGMIRFFRKDDLRAEAARERAADRESAANAAQRAYLVQLENAPMWEASIAPDLPGRVVSAWSPKSRTALRRCIASLDLAPLVASESLPAMVTLTLPGDWLAVAPDARTIAKKFDAFTMAWRSKWGPLVCIWKREFQRRAHAPRTVAGLDSGKAPHYHLWTVPPLPQSEMAEFRSWLSLTWTRILFSDRTCGSMHARDYCPCLLGPEHVSGGCSCSEYCRSIAAGTGVDFVAGLRARDPNRLAEYFLKESGHSEAKAYQNDAPPEWEGQSIGRFWGVRGIEKTVSTVDVHPDDQYRIWRVLRKVRRARSMPTHEWMVDRVSASGTVRRRKVTRRNRVTGIAGWVAVNDGASVGAVLGRYAASLRESPAIATDDLSTPHPNRRNGRPRRVSSNWPNFDIHEIGGGLWSPVRPSDGSNPVLGNAGGPL